MSDQQLPPMTLGTALEIVHGMAKRAFDDTPYTVEAVKAEAKLALDTVEDFIVNQFEEDEAANDTPPTAEVPHA